MRLPPSIEEALTSSGLPWAIERGTRHLKVRLAGHMVGILPRGKVPTCGRATQNVVAQIRRAARQLKEQN